MADTGFPTSLKRSLAKERPPASYKVNSDFYEPEIGSASPFMRPSLKL